MDDDSTVQMLLFPGEIMMIFQIEQHVRPQMSGQMAMDTRVVAAAYLPISSMAAQYS